MNNKDLMVISDLIDDRIQSAEEVDRAIDLLLQDELLQQKWSEYHNIKFSLHEKSDASLTLVKNKISEHSSDNVNQKRMNVLSRKVVNGISVAAFVLLMLGGVFLIVNHSNSDHVGSQSQINLNYEKVVPSDTELSYVLEDHFIVDVTGYGNSNRVEVSLEDPYSEEHQKIMYDVKEIVRFSHTAKD